MGSIMRNPACLLIESAFRISIKNGPLLLRSSGQPGKSQGGPDAREVLFCSQNTRPFARGFEWTTHRWLRRNFGTRRIFTRCRPEIPAQRPISDSFKDEGTQLCPTSMQRRWTIFANICDVVAVPYRMAAK